MTINFIFCLNQDSHREVKSQKSKVKILHLSESGGYRVSTTLNYRDLY
jgi:hypothetical protein